MRIGAIVLAAGSSRRMGANKALLPIDGKPMLLGIVASLNYRPLVVVTGHDRETIEKLLADHDVALAHNADHSKGGMLSSVKIGLKSLREQIDAVFIVLGDQPRIAPATLQELATRWQETQAKVVRPRFNGRHGHPILIDAKSIDAILALGDSATLNAFVAPNVVDVDVNDPATTFDIDTPEDYRSITE